MTWADYFAQQLVEGTPRRITRSRRRTRAATHRFERAIKYRHQCVECRAEFDTNWAAEGFCSYDCYLGLKLKAARDARPKKTRSRTQRKAIKARQLRVTKANSAPYSAPNNIPV